MVMVLLGGLSVLIVQAIGIGVMISAFRDDKERRQPDCTRKRALARCGLRAASAILLSVRST